ncbi:Dyp-type peroxidase [Streptomyces sp. ADMS]|uniref:Dyp-type peroxidase domain-containing protein n=1 Tax=Streptomyces sp. ADMS TaxID=3071415 RepID=UPI00296FFD43|nr:Dyp-type peroxidase domain-containing protein [Streptomyces sp. ADMS]MDW4908694.1 Dyp-type peroxidase [Streptomyces sp. ADMS]
MVADGQVLHDGARAGHGDAVGPLELPVDDHPGAVETAQHDPRLYDDVDIFAKTPQGRYVIPLRSHVRAAGPRLDAGARMLRRGYGYDAGPDDRGLLFVAFMRDPVLFARVQHRMTATDELSRFTEHRASAVAYVLPGALPGEDLGERLPA